MKLRKWVVKKKKLEDVLDDVFALYEECYEKRFRRKLRGSLAKSHVRDNLDVLIEREGVDVARDAIRALFLSPKMRWVTSCPDQFLANKNTFEHVARVLADGGPGEQAEWRGSREGESREMTADEFFKA